MHVKGGHGMMALWSAEVQGGKESVGPRCKPLQILGCAATGRWDSGADLYRVATRRGDSSAHNVQGGQTPATLVSVYLYVRMLDKEMVLKKTRPLHPTDIVRTIFPQSL